MAHNFGTSTKSKTVLLPRRHREDSWHNPKRVALPYITDRGCNTKIVPRSYAHKGKQQISKFRPEHSSSVKRDRQWSRIWMVIAPNNWLIASHRKCGSCPAWGSITILNRQEGTTLYQKTCNPQLLFPVTFRTICEQPSTEGHPPTIFLRILPTKDTTHYCSHAHQMALKTHPDRENRPRWCILTRPHKHTNSINMHRNCRKTSLSLYAPSLWHHTRTSRIYHHQWGSNQPWGKSPRRHVMRREKSTVASTTITYQERLPTCLWHSIQGRPARSGYWSKVGLNGWIHWWHHHHYHWWPTLGGARRGRIFIDHTHYIQISAVRQNPETRWPSLILKTCRRRSYCQSQDLSGMGHPDLFSTGIPTAMKGDGLDTQHQGIPSFNKNKCRQARIPHWQAQPCSLYHNTSKVIPESTPQPSKNRKQVGPTTSPVLAQTGSTALDKNPSMGCIDRSSDKQHRIHNSNIHTTVRRLWIFYK